MATEKRAEIAKHKTHRQQWAACLLVVIVVLCVGVVIWQSGIWRDESAAKLDALIERSKQQSARLEELRATRDELRAKLEESQAELKELRERNARDRLSP